MYLKNGFLHKELIQILMLISMINKRKSCSSALPDAFIKWNLLMKVNIDIKMLVYNQHINEYK